MWTFGGKLLQVEARASAKGPGRNTLALLVEEQGLWITASEESGSQWGQAVRVSQSAWEVMEPALGFSPRVKGRHLSLRVEWWFGFIYVYRNISCCVYVWLLFSILALFIAVTRCFVELKSPATKFVKHLSIQNRCTCRFSSCIQTILDQITFKFTIPALLALNPKYSQ